MYVAYTHPQRATQGPIIDAAVPAMQAIFSDNSAPPRDPAVAPPPSEDALDQPLVINLRQNTQAINKLLDQVTNLKDTLNSKIMEVADKVEEVSTRLIQYHKHHDYITFKGKIESKTYVLGPPHEKLGEPDFENRLTVATSKPNQLCSSS